MTSPNGPGGVARRPAPNRSAGEALAGQESDERRLNAARDAFPDWDISETYDGFTAVPKGTKVVFAINLDRLVLKLRQERDVL